MKFNSYVEQLKDIQLILSEDHFYQSYSPRIGSTHGMLYYKEMNIEQFMSEPRGFEKSMEEIID